MKNSGVLIALLVSFALAAWATEIVLPKDEFAGVGIPQVESNEWSVSAMYVQDTPTDKDMKPVGPDFFRGETGEDFSAEFTNGFCRSIGPVGREMAADTTLPRIRLGRGWGKYDGLPVYAFFDIEQSVEETEWTIDCWHGIYSNSKKFVVKAPKNTRTTVQLPWRDNRYLSEHRGIEVRCLTTNAVVKLHSLKLNPVITPMTFRGVFTLAEEPWRAGITIRRRPRYQLTVNGETVSQGLGIDGGRFHRIDASSLFHTGTNTVEFSAEYRSGYANPGEFLCEIFTVDRKGKRRIINGDSFNVKLGDGEWKRPRFSRNPLVFYGTDALGNGRRFNSGTAPLHAGPLQIKHCGPQYPVFGEDDEKIAFSVDLPPELTEYDIEWSVSNILEKCEAERSRVTCPEAQQNLEVAIKTRAPGAYKLYVALNKESHEIDHVRYEFVIAGEVKQDYFAFNDYDRELRKRMKLIDEQDCALDETNQLRYCESARMADDNGKPAHTTRVVNKDGLSYRETGEASGDLFAYHFNLTNLGKAHILEVDYPDTHKYVLHAAIEEAYAIAFPNNNTKCGNGYCNSSGAVRTGYETPLSGEKKTMSILFFPGSKSCGVYFETGGGRAAVCGWRLYEIDDLPALKLPQTDRLYGNHLERQIFAQWGAYANGQLRDSWNGCGEGQWTAAFAAAQNRIRELRYMGQNLAIEGVYMYKQGFPTESGESNTAYSDFDFNYVLSKMYRYNRIHAFACYEYIGSPKILTGGGYDIGDRDVERANGPVYPSNMIDANGHQIFGAAGKGLNYLAPHVWGSMTNLLTEIYARYEPAGGFEGLFVICNGYWLPGFPVDKPLTEKDVSFDDLTMELFAKDTGIDFKLPYTPARFKKRAELLRSPQYSKIWYDWRAKKIRDSLEVFQSICSTGKNKWRVYASPGVSSSRDTTVDYAKGGFEPSIYGKKSGSDITLVACAPFSRSHDIESWGLAMSAGNRAVTESNDAVYCRVMGLNERWYSMEGAKKWWWRFGGTSVFDTQPSDTGAFYYLADIMNVYTPRLLVWNWLDCDVPTGHSRESRRLATGLYATPEGKGTAFSGISGVTAYLFGSDTVQLVNDTAYPLVGDLSAKRLGFSAKVSDVFEGELKGSFHYRLSPYSVTVMKADDIAKKLSGVFRFEDASVADRTLDRLKTVLENKILIAKLPSEKADRLNIAAESRDAYAAAVLLRDYDVRRYADRFLGYVEKEKHSQSAEDLKPFMEFAAEDGKELKAEVDKQLFIPGRGKTFKTEVSVRRTVSMLVRNVCNNGSYCFGQSFPYRLDLFPCKDGEGFLPSITEFYHRLSDDKDAYRSIGMSQYGQDKLTDNEWHHIVYTIDSEGFCSVWADGMLVEAKLAITPAEGGKGPMKPTSGELASGRPNPKGTGFCGIEIKRVAQRDGILDWRDIQQETVEWLK